MSVRLTVDARQSPLSPLARRTSMGEGGFTIAEALVALFVFAMAGVALVQMQAQSVSAFTRTETRTLAGLVAENRLVEEMASAGAPVVGAREGEVEMAGRDWRWRTDIAPTTAPSTLRITVEVFAAETPAAAATLTGFRTLAAS